jgi:hypothetical protein
VGGADQSREGPDEGDRVAAQRHHVHLVHADVCEGSHLLDKGGGAGGVLPDRPVVEHGPADLVVRPALPIAPVMQHGELVGHPVGAGPGPGEHVAGVGVLGDQAERLPLTAPADHDRRARLLEGLR